MIGYRVYALLRVKLHALFCFAGIFIILEPRKHLKFKMGIDVRDFHVFFFIGAGYSRTSRLYDIQGG